VGVLGQSRHAVVFEMQPTATTAASSSSSAAPPPANVAVKVFPQQSEAYYDAEFANLKRLGEIFGPNPHVPHLNKDVGTVTEVVRGIMHVAIISLPVCAPVQPQPGGQRLRAAHHVQLLEVLQHAHQHRMYHCDVKPDNILMHGNTAILADWGISMFTTDNKRLPSVRQGTVGFSDFTLKAPGRPRAKHDLQAFVRTVYASYTDQHVPSVQREADEFWATQVRPGSMWERMLQRAKKKDYEGLKSDLTLL
jgi:hypothetical protein